MDESHVNGHVEYVTDEATTAARKCSYGLNEIKMIHFILLLFSSIVDLDQFMQISEREKCKSTVCPVDLSHCQKLILQLIDHMCKDKFVKTKILLSLSEIVDVYWTQPQPKLLTIYLKFLLNKIILILLLLFVVFAYLNDRR